MTNGGTLDGMRIEDPFRPTAPPGQDQLPFDDGEPMESQRHLEQMNVLIDSLRSHWGSRRDFYVGGNMFVYFSELQTRKNDFRGPDVFVVMDTDAAKERKSWVVWEEDGRLPDVVIELLSSSTEAIDRGEKKRIYERVWKVSTYVLYDPFTYALTVFERNAEDILVERERADVVNVPRLRLSLAVRPTKLAGQDVMGLRWIDGDEVLPTGEERAASQRARADAEGARADAESARADEESARADAAEARIRELEALLADR
ncbi:MAG: Uma2 family endonuclease [Deltaproteobacteria bacterium]|nr:Uma2 family endonuclease [Deltaproteobacteria bacterium]